MEGRGPSQTEVVSKLHTSSTFNLAEHTYLLEPSLKAQTTGIEVSENGMHERREYNLFNHHIIQDRTVWRAVIVWLAGLQSFIFDYAPNRKEQ